MDGGMLWIPARVTDRSDGVMRGKEVLFGRMRKDSLRMAERYGRLSRVVGGGRVGWYWLAAMQLVKPAD